MNEVPMLQHSSCYQSPFHGLEHLSVTSPDRPIPKPKEMGKTLANFVVRLELATFIHSFYTFTHDLPVWTTDVLSEVNNGGCFPVIN